MIQKLENCPICGERIVFAYNKSTKQGYYKCSNESCFFRVSMNYSEKEIALQGIEIKTKCRGCGSPLIIANGPKGFYATCLKCDYDSKPNMINGFIYKKQVNAHNLEAQKEVEELAKAYKGIVDESYSFDDLAEFEIVPVKEEVKNSNSSNDSSDEEIDREAFISFYNKGYSISQLSQKFNISKAQTRATKRQLLKENLISTYVNQKAPRASLSTLEKNENKSISTLDTVLNFFKDNPKRKLGVNDICKELNIKKSTVANYLTQMRKSGSIKVVDYIGDNNPLEILYAVKESPIPEAEIVEDNGKYVTPNYFFEKYKELVKKEDIYSPAFLNKFIMNEGVKSALMLTDQGLRKVYLEEDIKKLFKNKIKEVEKVSNKPKEVKKLNNKAPQETLSTRILNLLRKGNNINKPFSIQEMAKLLNSNDVSITYTAKKLRENKEMKIVGNRGSQILYQVAESPLPEHDVRTGDEYTTACIFFRDNREFVSSLKSLETKIKLAKLTSYNVKTRRGIGVGYKVEDLKKLYNKPSVESADINNNISDRKDISLSESADIPSKETLKKDLLGFVSSIFKKKNEESELEENEIISF